MPRLILITALILSFNCFAGQFSGLERQAESYTEIFGNPGSSFKVMERGTYIRVNRMNTKTVLKGAFYFGGNDARKRQLLTSRTQKNLCSGGFSAVYSVYNSVNKNIRCSENSIPYTRTGKAKASQNGGKKVYRLLEQIFRVIRSNGNLGPVYLHCWYGVHASNVIARMVEKQFCGVSNRFAGSAYMESTSGGAGSHAGRLAKIRNFEPYDEFQITDEEKSILCFDWN